MYLMFHSTEGPGWGRGWFCDVTMRCLVCLSFVSADGVWGHARKWISLLGEVVLPSLFRVDPVLQRTVGGRFERRQVWLRREAVFLKKTVSLVSNGLAFVPCWVDSSDIGTDVGG